MTLKRRIFDLLRIQILVLAFGRGDMYKNSTLGYVKRSLNYDLIHKWKRRLSIITMELCLLVKAIFVARRNINYRVYVE